MMTLDEAKALTHGQIIYQTDAKNSDGSPKRWRVSGKVKTWKRDNRRIRIPLKFGLYTNDALTERDFNENGVCSLFSLTEKV